MAFSQNKSTTNIKFSTGIAFTSLRWSIAGNVNGNNPNIYSELIWSGLKSTGLSTTLSHSFGKIEIQLGYSRYYFFDGKVTDTDYQENNRHYVSFYGLFDSDKGNQSDVQSKAGYRFKHLTLWVGYVLAFSKLTLLDHKGKYNPLLNSFYQTKWSGLCIGTQYLIHMNAKWTIQPSLFYQQLNYHAKGNWNLIADFKHPVSYVHRAKGYELSPSICSSYRLNSHINLIISPAYHLKITGNGIDELFKTNGQTPQTQLNEVKYQSFNLEFGLSYHL